MPTKAAFVCFLPSASRAEPAAASIRAPLRSFAFPPAMFFLVERTDSVALSPSAFGRNLRREVEDALRAKVEGKCTGKYGFTSQCRAGQDRGEERDRQRRHSGQTDIWWPPLCVSMLALPASSFSLPRPLFHNGGRSLARCSFLLPHCCCVLLAVIVTNVESMSQ